MLFQMEAGDVIYISRGIFLFLFHNNKRVGKLNGFPPPIITTALNCFRIDNIEDVVHITTFREWNFIDNNGRYYIIN